MLPPNLILDAPALATPVRALLAVPDALVTDWQSTLLSHQGRRSVYHIAGRAATPGGIRPWGLVLKVLQPSPAAAAAPPTSWAYWEREALVYQAGFTRALPRGICAPRCYGVTPGHGGGHHIWLEALPPDTAIWTVADYGRVAGHLGAFNGAYLAGRPAPQAAWLSQDWLADRTSDLPARAALLDDPATWTHPLVRQAFPAPITASCYEILARRAAWLALYRRLPLTFCHMDAWRGNLLTLPATGPASTLAFDWALAGYAPPGHEISPLIWVALLEFLIDAGQAAVLEATVWAAYLAGLRAAGWEGDARAVRFAYLASALLQWATVPEALLYATDGAEGAAAVARWHRPLAEIVPASAAVTYALLDRLAEANTLAAALD